MEDLAEVINRRRMDPNRERMGFAQELPAGFFVRCILKGVFTYLDIKRDGKDMFMPLKGRLLKNG